MEPAASGTKCARHAGVCGWTGRTPTCSGQFLREREQGIFCSTATVPLDDQANQRLVDHLVTQVRTNGAWKARDKADGSRQRPLNKRWKALGHTVALRREQGASRCQGQGR